MGLNQEKIALIDHYDSFSFNVLDWLIRGGFARSEVLHLWCDDELGLENLSQNPIPTVFGPGPNAPIDVPFSLKLAKGLTGRVPMLGICLGHQIFGHLAGATIKRAQNPWHGSQIEVKILTTDGLFAGLPPNFKVVCYNSLVIDPSRLGKEWTPMALNSNGEIMAMRRSAPGPITWSVQFHPESFLSEHGATILQNWLGSFDK